LHFSYTKSESFYKDEKPTFLKAALALKRLNASLLHYYFTK